MSMSVQPKAFSDALNRVVGAVERSKTMPVLAHVMLTCSGGFLTLRTTDLEIEITTAIDCEGDLPATCAPMDKLQATFAKLQDRGGVTFAMDGQLLVLTSGRSRFTMPTLPPDMFPSIKMTDIGATGTVEGKSLAALLNACAFAMANDAARPYLNGLYLFAGTIGNGKASKLCGIATDGHKLSAREVNADLPEDFPAVIATRKAVNILGKMVGGWDEVALEVSDTRLVAAFGPTRLTSKLVEGTFPDWRRVIPKVEPCLSFDSATLAGAIGTAFAAVQSDKSYGALKVTIGAEETQFSTKTRDGTTGGEDACAHSQLATPADTTIGANPKLFLEIIEALNADTIQLGFADAGSAILITAASLTDRKAILMPMRV